DPEDQEPRAFASPGPGYRGPGASPTRLAQPRHVAAHGGFAQLAAGEAELRVHGARTAGQRAAGAQARRAGVARQLLQLGRGGHLVVVARIGAGDDLLQVDALAAMPLDQLGALQVAVHHGFLGHTSLVSCGTGSGTLREAPWLPRRFSR